MLKSAPLSLEALSSRVKILTRTPAFWCLILLAVIGWIAHFWYFRQFGLYADDHELLARTFDWSFEQIADRVYRAFRYLPQGRPFEFSVSFVFTPFLFRLGGLTALYLAGFVVVTANAWASFAIARQLTGSARAGFVAGLIILLYPIVTIHIWLTASLIVMMSLLCFQLAVYAYLNDRRLLAYVLIVVVLFYYEIPYPVFVIVPFLKKDWKWREVIFTAGYLAVWMIIAYVARRLVGEERVLALDPLETARRIVVSMFQGPYIALTALIPAVQRVFNQLTLDMVLLGVLGGGLTFAILRRRTPALPLQWRVLLVSILGLSFGYVLSFTHFPPVILEGPGTTIHMGALFCIALIAGCLSVRIPALPLTLSVSVTIGYHVIIQHTYRDGWALQRSFWSQVVEVAPDLENETVIYVEGDVQLATRFGYGVDWAANVALRNLYNFSEYTQEPRIILATDEPAFQVRWLEGAESDAAQYFYWRFNIRDGNVIVLNWRDGMLTRSSQATVMIDGREVQTKPLGVSTVDDLARRPMADIMLLSTAP